MPECDEKINWTDSAIYENKNRTNVSTVLISEER